MNYVIAFNNGTLSVVAMPTAPPVSSLPSPVIAAFTGTSSASDVSIDQGTESGESAASGMSLRTVRNTSSIPPTVNPCIALAAQDTLPNQMFDVMDIVSISPELAETLPFYKTQTRPSDPAHISCQESVSQLQN